MLVVSETDVRRMVSIEDAIPAVEEGFTRLVRGEVSLPPVMSLEIPESKGEAHVKGAHNCRRRQFRHQGGHWFLRQPPHRAAQWRRHDASLQCAYRRSRGTAVGQRLPDRCEDRSGWRHCRQVPGKAEVEHCGSGGAGAQGRFQIMALARVRDFDRVLVHDVNPSRLKQYIEEMPDIVEVTCQARHNLRNLVSESEVLITATPATEPHIRAEWLHPRLHITAMGADSPDKQDLENAVLGRADLLVCDLKVQCFERGELHHALEDGTIDKEDEIVDLGELTSGRHPGRTNNSQMTVCDLMGVGVQDAAIATLAYEKALQNGLGSQIEL